MKQAKFLLMVFCIAMLAGCASTPKWEDMTFEERIATADTFSKITSCINEYDIEYVLSRNSYSEEEKNSIKSAIAEAEISYMFSDGKLNGTYYYNENLSGLFTSRLYGDEVSYTIVVYSVSGDEIYVLPIEDAPDEIQDIPNLPSASEYKYKAEMRRGGSLGHGGKDDPHLAVDLIRTLDDYEVSIAYFEDAGYLAVYDNFPQQLDADGKGTMPTPQDYYLDEAASLETAQNEHDGHISEIEARREEDEKLSQSAPKIGMTKDEVKKSAWGNPDKKNIDTYSWGTSEQWVYRSKGYVYFKNGVVTSVSTSEY